MNFLLDTNVISEWIKPNPDPGVVAWLAEVDEDRTYISVVTIAELRHGIERMVPGRRQKRLNEWIREDLVSRFEDRILPIDDAVAESWGKVMARCETAGRSMSAMDAFIAATAEFNGLTLITRNVSDFACSVASTLNPWSEGSDLPRSKQEN